MYQKYPFGLLALGSTVIVILHAIYYFVRPEFWAAEEVTFGSAIILLLLITVMIIHWLCFIEDLKRHRQIPEMEEKNKDE